LSQFDAGNRLTNTITPGTRETKLTYEGRGLVSTVREPSGQMATNYYDARDRLTNRADSVGSTLFRYDANNNLAAVIEAGRSNCWRFNAYDRVTAFTNQDGYVIQYRSDANGNVTNLVYPGNRNVFYAFDSLNRLTNVTDWSSRKTSFEYDLANRLKKITRPNGAVREMNYDAAGEMTNIWEKTAAGTPIAMFKLSWNNAARVEWEFAAPPPHAYTPPTRDMTYDDDNRIATFNETNVSYDLDGNMTCGPLTNNTFVNCTFDARNRLTGVGGLSFGYDCLGNRTSITIGTNLTRFVVNPNATLSQVLMRIQGAVTNYYIYGAGLLYEITETATNTATATYHYDYRGSTVAITDGSGNVTDRIEYSAYGTTTYRAGNTDTPFLFNGRYGVQTDASGLLYMRARYYNPYLCRFINPDPVGFAGGLNWYAYADGNPVSFIDPFGLGADSIGPISSWLNTSGAVGAAGVLEQAALVRDGYNAWVAQHVTASGGYEPSRDAIRAFWNQPANSTALSRGVGEMYRWEQRAAQAQTSLANPTGTSPAVNNAAATAKWGGRGLIVVGAGLSVYDVATAPDPYRATAQNGAAIAVGAGGATAGAWTGAGIGSLLGPGVGTAIGAVIGAIGGGIGGGIGGNALGGAAYDANYGPNSPWFPINP